MKEKIKNWINSYKEDVRLSKSETKAWKIIIFLGCFMGLIIGHLMGGADSFWSFVLDSNIDPYNDYQEMAFLWAITGGAITFLVLYSNRLLNQTKENKTQNKL